jgi:hypothetical protein
VNAPVGSCSRRWRPYRQWCRSRAPTSHCRLVETQLPSVDGVDATLTQILRVDNSQLLSESPQTVDLTRQCLQRTQRWRSGKGRVPWSNRYQVYCQPCPRRHHLVRNLENPNDPGGEGPISCDRARGEPTRQHVDPVMQQSTDFGNGKRDELTQSVRPNSAELPAVHSFLSRSYLSSFDGHILQGESMPACRSPPPPFR